MTRLGFLLDSESCIGCHACTVACKSEHDVPLGVNRTWLKYIETGAFPDVDRRFTVMRCNHCDDAPCMTICPTSALFRAPNGVVDFDDGNCIGCKACMNACPYDALYINPETNTAHKCNFCNHRIEVGLEPSCVIVCPTEAIKVGDLDDPDGELSRLVASGVTTVRAPEQNTKPKVHYRGASQTTLDPTRSAIAPDGLIWAETTVHHPSVDSADPDAPGRTTYTTAHPMPWKSMVSGYLVTKAIAAGVMLVAALLVGLGHADVQAAVGVMPPVVAGLFLAATGFLLVADLKQPMRFHYLLTRPNWSSWLVRGAIVLMAFAVVCGLWWIGGLAEAETGLKVLAIPAVVGAVGTAGYTAFLFGQCEGRDLWQRPLLLPILVAQAVTAGGASYAIADLFMFVPEGRAVRWVLLAGAAATLVLVAVEVSGRHGRTVDLATRELTRGKYMDRFWFGVLVGTVSPIAVTAIAIAADSGPVLPALAGVAAVLGMFAYEDGFVRAGQSVPLS